MKTYGSETTPIHTQMIHAKKNKKVEKMNRTGRKKFLTATKAVTKADIVAVENKLPAIVNAIIFSMCLNSILPRLPLTLLVWK